MQADLRDVVFRRAEFRKWTVSWPDYLGFLSCASVIASLVLLEYMRTHSRPLFDRPNYDLYVLGSLGIGALLVGIAGFIRATFHRQIAIPSVVGLLGSALPIFVVVINIALAWQR